MSISHESSRVKLTFREHLLFPDDGNRHEIIDGFHYMNAAPTPRHQTISRLLQFQLMEHIEMTDRGQVFNAPIDVQFSETDVVEPDLVIVLTGNDIVTESRILGAPDLVVEILSPSTRDRDQQLKKLLYCQSGVPEYWIVDPADNFVDRYLLNEAGAYSAATRHTDEIQYAFGEQTIRVDLKRVW